MDQSAKLWIKVHEHAEVCMALHLPLIGLSDFKLARIAFGTEDKHILFPGAFFTNIPFPVISIPHIEQVTNFPRPPHVLQGSVTLSLPVPLQFGHFISPPNNFPRSFSVILSRLMDFGLPEPLQSGHSFSLRIMEPEPLQFLHSIVIDLNVRCFSQ